MPDSKMGLRIRLDPDEGKRLLLERFRECGGMPTKVAEAEGVAHSTVKRWVATLGIRDEIDEIRKELGLSKAGPFGADEAASPG